MKAPSEKTRVLFGISAIFSQCCFMSETQLLMTVFDFLKFFWQFFSRNHFLEGGFTFQWGCWFSIGRGLYFQVGIPGGYNEKLTYQQQGQNNEKTGKNQKKNNIILWFNPPYSKLLKTQTSVNTFLDFSPNIFHWVTNLTKSLIKTLELSYSCMPNLKVKIDGHNKKILENTPLPKNKNR